MRKTLFLTIISLAFLCWGQDETIVESVSCKISMTVAANKSNPGDLSGSAIVDILLIDKSGNPIAGHEIELRGNGGTLLCRMPGDTSKPGKVEDDRSCYMTAEDGKARLFLVNIPFNTTIKLKAAATCGDFQVTATGTAAVTRSKPPKPLVP